MVSYRSRKDADPNSKPEPSSGGVNGSSSVHALGAMLRERREAIGVTLAEAEVATRIRQKYLSALEADEWSLLPGEIVGRGFLRNYSEYLGLETMELMERRRAIADDRLERSLRDTSAGSSLPPVRQVDYRPKEVNLKDENDDLERREIRLGPIFSVLFGVALFFLVIWGISALREPFGALAQGVGTRVASVFQADSPTPTPPLSAGVVNDQNVAAVPLGDETGIDANQLTPDANNPAVLLPAPTATSTPAPPPTDTPPPLPTDTPPPPPTDTPLPPPTDTPPPLPPTDTPTPEPPTETPTPEPPLVVSPVCSDVRSVLTAPGVNQVVSGLVGVTGTAIHEAFQYYKLEYAPGIDVGDGFVYFDGASSPVLGGLLGNMDTRALANGGYTIRLIVVDQSGNFPPPCQVSVTVQN